MKILWCITGAGEFLEESINAINSFGPQNVVIFISKAGEQVLKTYNLFDKLKEFEICLDDDASASKAGSVTLMKYNKVIVSPATANTVAKIANGISDNLVTTAVALAIKAGVPTYLVPTDWLPKGVKIPNALVPGGKKVHMKPRESDLRNISYLQDEDIQILESPELLLKKLEQI